MSRKVEIFPYRPTDAATWDRIVEESDAACLLFLRRYMDYHANRFADASLVGVADGSPIGVYPASIKDHVVTSHAGLTFGSWQLGPGLSEQDRRRLAELTFDYYESNGVKKLVARETPQYFNSSETWSHASYRPPTSSTKLDGSAIDLSSTLSLGPKRRLTRCLKALQTHEFSSSCPEEFWPLLERVLLGRHGVSPTHSLRDIQQLYSRLPSQIQVFKAASLNDLAAGAVIFLSRNVAHIQYMATSEAGRVSHALDGLIVWLIRRFAGQVRWLSLGVSNERDGTINQGLHDYKMSFGAKHFVHETNTYDLSR